jgi:hypothetical protein
MSVGKTAIPTARIVAKKALLNVAESRIEQNDPSKSDPRMLPARNVPGREAWRAQSLQ